MRLLPFLVGAVFTLLTPSTTAEPGQEHSHDMIIASIRTIYQSNTNGYPLDPATGLLDSTAIRAVLATSTAVDKNADNLQQNIADAVVTNCKKQNVDRNSNTTQLCIARAIQYRALERNTAQIGSASPLSTTLALNRELHNITQHQDPAAEGAEEHNRGVEKMVATRLRELGVGVTEAVAMALETAGVVMGNVAGEGNACNGFNGTQEVVTPDERKNPYTGTVAATPPTISSHTTSPSDTVYTTEVVDETNSAEVENTITSDSVVTPAPAPPAYTQSLPV
ncbi:hypothetical protein DFJ77DRAFT_435558, partial [Powellomyces hirtus]